MWEILLTRVFTLWTFSAGDVKSSTAAHTGFIALCVLSYIKYSLSERLQCHRHLYTSLTHTEWKGNEA